ncbi:nucleotidyl transferase AbiEii/AbiGii toxin family protein [Kitasatospora sp. LaBMicrA B282]|uniref:nucleotidyl transferase AbiEii/AbiGii toxin family protein n=1 Tax=Kitasatospora sp. LaBMicrA B282 TaxID=3420949 RepID=UPI003D0C9EDB
MTSDQNAPAADWEGFEYGPWEEVVLPKQTPSEELRERLGLPRGVHPIDHEAVTQQPVFDPALAGYTRALRPSEPAFTDPEVAARWCTARREALNTVLSAVAQSDWAEHLVLRGSILLRAWFGDAAREPGDLDFVVRPVDWELEDPRTERMLGEIAAGAQRLSDRVVVHADQATTDGIWTYGRVPGRRLVVPWSAPGVPGGTVQLDFVFTEPLPAEPRPESLPGVSGPLLAATPELSLAWKVLWLLSDSYPQGKDLYDAVLLAGSAELPYELLRQVFAQSDPRSDRWPVVPETITDLDVEWDEFAKDYPQLAADGEEYPDRLLAALAPTFAGRSEYELRAHWLAPLVERLREVLAAGGTDAVGAWFAEDYVQQDNRMVLLAELLGRDVARAHQVMDAWPDGSAFRAAELTGLARRFAAQLAGEG